MLNQIDLNKLRVFVAVYRHRSVQKTAQELHITASAVSQSLKSLEEQLNHQLLIRSSRAIVPTEAGRQLFEKSSHLLEELSTTLFSLRDLNIAPRGTIKIATFSEFGSNFLIHAIAQFRKLYPEVNFHFQLGAPRKSTKLLIENLCDFAFLDEPPPSAEGAHLIELRELFAEDMIAACSRQFEEQHLSGAKDFETLQQVSHVLFLPDGGAFRLWYQHHFGKIPKHFPSSVSVDGVHAIVHAIKQGLGIGLIPRYILKRDIKKGKVVELLPNSKQLDIPIYFAKLKERKLTLTELTFVDFVTKELQKLGKSARSQWIH